MNATTIIFFIAFVLQALTALPTDPATYRNSGVGNGFPEHKFMIGPSNDCYDGTKTVANISTTTCDYEFTLNVGVSPKKTLPALKYSVPGVVFNQPITKSDNKIQDLNDEPRKVTEFSLAQPSGSSNNPSVPHYPRHVVSIAKSESIQPSPAVHYINSNLQPTDHIPISGFSHPINTQMETPVSETHSNNHVRQMPKLKLSLPSEKQDKSVENQPTEPSINPTIRISKVANLPTANFLSKSQTNSDSSQTDETPLTANESLPQSPLTKEMPSINLNENKESPLENPQNGNVLSEEVPTFGPYQDESSTENSETKVKSPSEESESEIKGKSPSDESESETKGKSPSEESESEIKAKSPSEESESETNGKSPSEESETKGKSPSEKSETKGKSPSNESETEDSSNDKKPSATVTLTDKSTSNETLPLTPPKPPTTDKSSKTSSNESSTKQTSTDKSQSKDSPKPTQTEDKPGESTETDKNLPDKKSKGPLPDKPDQPSPNKPKNTT